MITLPVIVDEIDRQLQDNKNAEKVSRYLHRLLDDLSMSFLVGSELDLSQQWALRISYDSSVYKKRIDENNLVIQSSLVNLKKLKALTLGDVGALITNGFCTSKHSSLTRSQWQTRGLRNLL